MIRKLVAITSFAALTAVPAIAQTTFVPPRFDALDLQKQMQEQNRIDHLEKQKQDAQAKVYDPAAHVSQADNAITQLRLQSENNRVMLDIQQERDRVAREAAIRDVSIPNRRIAPSSILVVANPSAYALPAAPKGQYYARINGRFVLVDRASELVVKVLDDQPGYPADDKPVQPRSPLLPAVPADRIGQPDPGDLSTPR
jgi:Ni/Co efflux regulator RcnB